MKRPFATALGSVIAGGALCLASACGAPPATGATTPQSPAAQCSRELPSYERTVRPLLAEHCLKCHRAGESAGEDHDFTRFETLHAQHRSVAALLRSGAMPPPPARGPTPDERAIFVRWASCGAPKN